MTMNLWKLHFGGFFFFLNSHLEHSYTLHNKNVENTFKKNEEILNNKMVQWFPDAS